jgi:hypothetical protein
MIPDTIPCGREYRDPDTGGVSACEPVLDEVLPDGSGELWAFYRHQCDEGLEMVPIDAMLADAAASAVARDEVVGEIVEEER